MASVPPLLLIGTGIICLGDLLHIIGLGTPHWEESDVLGIDASVGLFKYCNDDTCATIEEPTSEREAAQAMAIIGMLCGLLAGTVVIAYVVLNVLSKTAPKILTMVCTAACMAGFVFIIIGVIIYGAKIHADNDSDQVDLGYSFGLCITGAILLAVGGALVFVGGKSI